MFSLSAIRFKQTYITNVFVHFYNKRLKKLFLFQNNISNDDRSSNRNNKYTRTPAITLSATRIRMIATLESATTTPATATTETTATTTVTAGVIIVKTITKARVVEALSTLTMILVTDPARNQILIRPNLEPLYLQSNLSTHNVFGQTPLYNVFLEYLRI